MAEVGKILEISNLFIYPIKSCRGISLPSTTLTRQGLQHDRKWMFVDAKNNFITIRTNSQMTLINTSIDTATQQLNITFPEVSESGLPSKTISVPLEPDAEYIREKCTKIDVEIWEYETDAYTYTSPDITEAIRGFFATINPDSDVKLVMKGPTARQAKGNGSPEQLGRTETVNFPDVLPILVASETSLEELNGRLQSADEDVVTMERFRPNIVVRDFHHDTNPDNGGDSKNDNNISNESSDNTKSKLIPWEEDEWRLLTINPPETKTAAIINTLSAYVPTTISKTLVPSLSSPFTPASEGNPTSNQPSIQIDVSARCARCQVPNVNPQTGIKNPKQPWDTLVKYRRIDEGIKYKPCFGMLCCPRGEGVVGIGMKVEVSGVTESVGGKGTHRYIKGF